jgi:uncharacterized protein (UPF0264 family)
MRLLVSVSDDVEASAALRGGADIIDAKNPRAGALGAVSIDVLHAICKAVATARPVTAAIGDAVDCRLVETTARRFARAGARLVKVGFAGVRETGDVRALIESAVRGTSEGMDLTPHRQPSSRRRGVIAVAYADHDRAAAAPPDTILDAAIRFGARGVLIDTFDKDGPGLRGLLPLAALRAWVAAAHEAGLLASVAGQLRADDMAWAKATGADVAGVRGAACDGGRSGRVSSDHVKRLAGLCAAGERAGVKDPACDNLQARTIRTL